MLSRPMTFLVLLSLANLPGFPPTGANCRLLIHGWKIAERRGKVCHKCLVHSVFPLHFETTHFDIE